MKRYKKYIFSKHKPAAEIIRLVRAWGKKNFILKDPDLGNVTLGYADSMTKLEAQLGNAQHVSISGEHRLATRKKPNQKHDLTVEKTALGEKAEVFHASSGEFSKSGTGLDRAHAQFCIGTDRWNKNRQQTYLYDAHESEAPKFFITING